MASAIRKARKKLHLKPGQLALLVGVGRTTVVGWEAGTHGIRPEHAIKVAQVLGLTFRRAELA